MLKHVILLLSQFIQENEKGVFGISKSTSMNKPFCNINQLSIQPSIFLYPLKLIQGWGDN